MGQQNPYSGSASFQPPSQNLNELASTQEHQKPESQNSQSQYGEPQLPYGQPNYGQPHYGQPTWNNSNGAPKTQPYNRGFYDSTDPIERAGYFVESFSFANIFRAGSEKSVRVASELFREVYKDLSKKTDKTQNVQFQDVRIGDLPRQYIVAQRVTVRNTLMSLYITFRPDADDIYTSVTAFVLGAIDTSKLLRALLFSALPLLLFSWGGSSTNTSFVQPYPSYYPQQVSSTDGGFPLLVKLALVAIFETWYWRDAITGLRQGEPLGRALRHMFGRKLDVGYFNTDDVNLFFRSAEPVVLGTIKDVFERNGIPTERVNTIIQQIGNRTAYTITNNGPITGSNIGPSGTVTNNTAATLTTNTR